MPAYHNTLQFGAVEDMILVTGSDVTELTFKNVGSKIWYLIPTVGAVVPTDKGKAIPVKPGEGEQNLVLADAFPGVVGVTRLYVYAPNGGRGFFSHG